MRIPFRIRSKLITQEAFGGLVFALLFAATAISQEMPTLACEVLQRFKAEEATRGVIVDSKYFYPIGDRVIALYGRETGTRLMRWTAKLNSPVRQLYSGVIRDGKLYCAHASLPEYPTASSVESWDIVKLRHIESHSLGIGFGLLVGLDWHQNAWWGVFTKSNCMWEDASNAHSAGCILLVRFDDQWRSTGEWVFPLDLRNRLEPNTVGCATWGPDGKLYCTGQERGEVYQLQLPFAGSILRWSATYTAPITGGGICWDSERQDVFYGIDRDRAEVVVLRTPNQSGQLAESGVEEPN